jgi:hypothetical protein
MSLKFFRAISVDEQELIDQYYFYPKDHSILHAIHGIRQEKLGNFIAAAEQYAHSQHPIALERLGWLQPILSRQNLRQIPSTTLAYPYSYPHTHVPSHAHTHVPSHAHTHVPSHAHTHVPSHTHSYIAPPTSPVMNFHAPTTVNFNPVGQQATLPSVILPAKKIEEDSSEKPVSPKRKRRDEATYDYTLQMIDYCQEGFLKLDEVLTIDKFAHFLGMSYSGTCNRLTKLREMELLGPALNISEEGRAHLKTLSPLENPIEITREKINNISHHSTSSKKQKVTVEPITEADPYLSNPPKELVFSRTSVRSTLPLKPQQAAIPAVQTSTSTPTPVKDKRMSLKFLTS